MEKQKQKKVYVLRATLKRPDGTVQQLSNEEARRIMFGYNGKYVGLPPGDVTVSWVEGTSDQILDFLANK